MSVRTMERLRAPFTPEQVAALNAYQASNQFHPFTCGDRSTPAHHARQAEHPNEDLGQLVAGPQGWTCPATGCAYTQDWAWQDMVTAGSTEQL